MKLGWRQSMCLAAAALMTAGQSLSAADFVSDVRPILQRVCFECHGAEKHEGGLRLDQRDAALRGGDSGRVLVAGKPDDSELLRRVSLPRGHDDMMPPRGKPLTAREVKLLREWITAGAVWPENADAAKHWAYVKPARPTTPELRNPKLEIRNPIDAFVAERLLREGLQPSPEADRATLARRLSFDLIGLPPPPAEVEAFVRDTDPAAYEKLVDRLLRSKEFGVKWARPWLDLARYADSHGFQRDDLREVWAYRDWVVKALNADMPFDQFTIEQIAGDLLPNPTQEQLVATGFHRCTPTNVEAGTEPEESRINQVIDRVNTTGAVWLGTTLECAQCHNHKYDPITQRDYYRLLAYFNNTEAEADRSNPKVPGSIRFLGPTLPLTDAAKETERAALRKEIAKLTREISQHKSVTAATNKTELLPKDGKAGAAEKSPRIAALSVTGFDADSGAESESQADGSILLTGDVPDTDTYTVELKIEGQQLTAIQLEALRHASLPGGGPGRGDPKRTNFVLHEFEVELISASTTQRLRFKTAHASFAQTKFSAQGAIDGDLKTAWAIAPEFDRSHTALFVLAEPIDAAEGATLKVRMVQNFGSGRVIGCFRVSGVFGKPDSLVASFSKNSEPSSAVAKSSETKSDSLVEELERRKSELQKRLEALDPGSSLVMKELPQPRVSSMFQRGEYTQPGEPVTAGTPAVLPPAGEGPPNRLTLARWLVSPDNPLTARVTVNRWWAEIFGQGLVTTVEDFGIKGETPTHPELLDWLAVEFQENGWSLKRLLKQIVMSATYRQSSRVTPNLLAQDDRNRLYARGPRFRLDAEAIRDNALSIAGLLSLNKGGPSIRPPQPDGLWRKVGGQQYKYEVSSGEQQYRRGLYVVLKRGSPYPSFVNFDSSSRMACVVKRSRSNTPLQALTLFNDPVYVEAARTFARRIITERPQADVETRIAHAFRIALSRSPRDNELAVLRNLYDQQLRQHTADESSVKRLLENVSCPENVTLVEFAAWYALTSALLNLDETITKG
ncbi:MAG: PSD1 domain-containing protein [Planctomycetaceae bacterium]|nr:PSD1 domain-containing protein [Planctomycetaceae bacterium]